MSGKNNVFINGMTPVTSVSEGTVAGFADICRTPSPSGPVPIPYSNVAKSESLENGSKNVRIDGAPVCLSDSYLGTSTGNEAATAGGGVISGKTKGRAHPFNYSFDVKIEGKPVVRNFDPFTLNDHNTLPFPIMQPQGSPPEPVRVDEPESTQPEERCDYCGKPRHDVDRKGRVGSNLGSSAVLGRNMLEGRELTAHPWYAGPFSLAAHHLICLEALDNSTWARNCTQFGYHPDRRENGVFLPMKMAVACQLSMPVHRGNHAEGFAYDLHLPYPKAVKKKLDAVVTDIEAGQYCSNPEALVSKLDKVSADILSVVATFTWTLTRDGLDYAPDGNGCAGLKSIREKPAMTPCPQSRRHQVTHTLTGLPLAKRVLAVGE